jgi:hypothetical protein
MGIGRIASLLGSLSPTAAPAEQAAPDAPGRDEVIVAPPGGMESEHRPGEGKADMAAQIQQLLSAIQQLHATASEDGAAMAFSRSGASLRDAVGGLGHLLATARDTGAKLPQDLVQDSKRVVGEVETGLSGLKSAIQQRMDAMEPHAAARIGETASRFVAEMQAALNHVRGALAGFR